MMDWPAITDTAGLAAALPRYTADEWAAIEATAPGPVDDPAGLRRKLEALGGMFFHVIGPAVLADRPPQPAERARLWGDVEAAALRLAEALEALDPIGRKLKVLMGQPADVALDNALAPGGLEEFERQLEAVASEAGRRQRQALGEPRPSNRQAGNEMRDVYLGEILDLWTALGGDPRPGGPGGPLARFVMAVANPMLGARPVTGRAVIHVAGKHWCGGTE